MAIGLPGKQPNRASAQKFGGRLLPKHLLVCGMLCIPSGLVAQQSTGAPQTALHTGILVIDAGPGQRGVFTPATLQDYPHQTVTVINPHTKASEIFSGVPLMDLLSHLGVPHGKDLHGKALAEYLVGTGSDGYKIVLSLAETDPDFHPGQVLIADSMDGKPLNAKNGPFQLIVTEDKLPARFVRNLVSIDLKTAE